MNDRATAPSAPASEHAAALRRPVILVVDDQPENIDVLRGVLRDAYLVRIATSGPRALDIAANDPPDLILLDVSMPDMDGYDVCARLKRDFRTSTIPVIFVTAMASVEDEMRGFEMGAVDYITKPISPGRVLARVRTQLALSSQSRHLSQMVEDRTRELNRTRQLVIERLGRAAEYKDDESGNHVIRMAHYTRLLALANGASEAQAHLLFEAAPMHDLGKIGVPDSVLSKAWKLTEQEWELMRMHPQLGANIIGEHDDPLLSCARSVALGHHEKWDGTGYPFNQRGIQIPLAARIVAIADVFDALTSDRPYKKAWPVEQAFNYVRDQSGHHFDPILVPQFLSIAPQLEKVLIEHREDNGPIA